MKKLSVVNLIDIKPDKLGALEEYALHLSGELVRRDHLALVGFSASLPQWLATKFDVLGIDVVVINPRKGLLPLVTQVRELIRKYDLNIVHATFYPFYSPALPASILGKNCKLIYSDQMSRIRHRSKGVRSLFHFLKNRCYLTCIHAIIADALFIKECQIQDYFTKPDKVPVIYNGVNLERFRRAHAGEKSNLLHKFKLPDDASIIVTIAQCIGAKGLNYLIDAAAIVEKTHPVIFFIMGDGPERSALEQQAVALGLRDKIIFTGMRIDTEAFLSVADIFVLPSVWEEAFAFSLLEAMASNCPVVATRIGAIPESVVDGLTGILVPPRDARATADAILRLLGDDVLRLAMGIAARKRVEDHFSLQRWVDETIAFYEEALNGG